MCQAATPVCPHTIAIVATVATYAAPLGLYPSPALALTLATLPIGAALAISPVAGIVAVLALASVAIFSA